MKTFFGWALIVIGGAATLVILGYWFVNPELTEMQIFKKWWSVQFGSILAFWYGQKLLFED